MYEGDDFGNAGAHKSVRKLGQTIKNKWKPDFIVVVSAHWQLNGFNLAEIAVPKSRDGENPLIYDFYGFPKHMYQETFRSLNSKTVSSAVRDHLRASGFASEFTERGIDHGTWVPFKVAFSDYNTLNPAPEGTKPELDLPDTSVVQVSLTGNDRDFDTLFKLGQALSFFRENLIWDEASQKYLKGLVVCSGMSVHNLRDLGRAMQLGGKPMPYAASFNKLLRGVLVNSDGLLDRFNVLKTTNKQLLYAAHPTLEHFDPLVVAGGIASKDSSAEIKELYNAEQLSLGWGIYQIGPSPKHV